MVNVGNLNKLADVTNNLLYINDMVSSILLTLRFNENQQFKKGVNFVKLYQV